jgi:energy-coupling factor transport system substrate-specific component
MYDLISMWKNPKMIAFTLLTAGLYAALIFPVSQFSLFGGHADFERVGIGVPVAFSFLFGPAAAWGAAIGNVIRDIATNKLNVASIPGFIGNFLIGYIPYKLWRAVTAEKPNMKSLKTFGLFVGIAVLACSVCGLIIGWGLLWLGWAPFMPTAFLIGLTDAVWAIVLGSILLALTYTSVSKHGLLYTDILKINQPAANWSKTRSLGILVFCFSTLLCFTLTLAFSMNHFVLLSLVAISFVATAVVCR